MTSTPADHTVQLRPDITQQRAPAFTIGDMACHIIRDGQMLYPLDFLYPDAPQGELQAGVAGRLDEPGELPLPYRCLLVQTPSQNLLIDTGLGREAAAAGWPAVRLLENLAKAEFSPGDIDVVVLSHAHPDHIGGLADGSQLTFPKARHVMSATEWECWTDEDPLARMPDDLADPARAVLPLLARADVVDLVQGETEVIPGLSLITAPGHTVGHCAVRFTAGSERAVFRQTPFWTRCISPTRNGSALWICCPPRRPRREFGCSTRRREIPASFSCTTSKDWDISNGAAATTDFSE